MRTIQLDRVGSTQDEIHQLAEAGEPDGTAVVAREQTAGRGRRGRHWESPVGGVWLSVLRRPTEAAPPLVMSLSVGLAVAHALEAVGIQEVQVKWPNDLLVNDAKIGGILCEVRWHGDVPAWAAIGVGINVENPAPSGVIGPATSVTEHTRERIAPGDVASSVIGAIRSVPLNLTTLDTPAVAELRRRDWLSGAILLEPVPGGVCTGIDRTGALVVRGPAGTVQQLRNGPVVVDTTIVRTAARQKRLTSEPEPS
ncbi:MAG: biotin--[acetyl-CoA-carboxylase] ligase [Gemmatimonadales bacterium]|nr:biotin--[acetyl-CoA-carboxylase] ligase [Gemmatimonadales bacterium]